MRKVVAKRLRKETAVDFTSVLTLKKRRDGSLYWNGYNRAYRDRKKAYKHTSKN
jgi:hypothetical protein